MSLLCPFSDADAPRLPLLAEATYGPGELAAPPVPPSPPERVLSRADWVAEALHCLRLAIDAGPEDSDAEALRRHAYILDAVECGLRGRE